MNSTMPDDNMTLFIPKFTIRLSNRYQEVLMEDAVLAGPSRGSVLIGVFVLASLFLAAALLNALVAAVLCQRRSLRSANLFLLSLCGSNAASCLLMVLVLVISGTEVAWYTVVPAICRLAAFAHLVVLIGSCLTLPLIAVDRYYAIVKPLVYHTKLSRARRLYLLCAAWILAIIGALCPLVGFATLRYEPAQFHCTVHWAPSPVYAAVFVALAFLAPFCIMSLSYLYIYFAARLQSAAESGGRERVLSNAADASSKGRRLRAKMSWLIITYSSSDKAMRTIVALLGAFLGYWAPYLIWLSLELLGHRSAVGAYFAFLLFSLSHLTYPLLYGFMNKAIRKRLKQLVSERRNALPETRTSHSHSFFDFLPRRPSHHSYLRQWEPFNLLGGQKGAVLSRSLSQRVPKTPDPPSEDDSPPLGPLRRGFNKSPLPLRRGILRASASVPKSLRTLDTEAPKQRAHITILTGTNAIRTLEPTPYQQRMAKTEKLLSTIRGSLGTARALALPEETPRGGSARLCSESDLSRSPSLSLYCGEPSPSPSPVPPESTDEIKMTGTV